MPLTAARKATVFAFALAVLVALVLGASGRAAATQNQPSWSVGDYWTYSASGGGTLTWLVQRQTTLTIGTTAYSVWYVTVSTTEANTTVTVDMYLTTGDLRIAKTSGTVPFLGTISEVYDPPQPQAAFPLNPDRTWSGTSSVTRTIGSFSTTQSEPYSGTVLDERSITVPAGTFTVATIRTPSTGNAHTRNYYSESVGWLVKTESYNGFGTLASSQELTSYRYSGSLGTIVLILGILVVVAIVAAAAFLIVRRRPRMPRAQYPGPYPPGGYPPPQPPGRPPTGRTPPGP